jgi:hypothetical protein
MCVRPGERATDEPGYRPPQAGPGPRPDQANRKQPLSNPEIDILYVRDHSLGAPFTLYMYCAL